MSSWHGAWLSTGTTLPSLLELLYLHNTTNCYRHYYINNAFSYSHSGVAISERKKKKKQLIL